MILFYLLICHFRILNLGIQDYYIKTIFYYTTLNVISLTATTQWNLMLMTLKSILRVQQKCK